MSPIYQDCLSVGPTQKILIIYVETRLPVTKPNPQEAIFKKGRKFGGNLTCHYTSLHLRKGWVSHLIFLKPERT
jgi:hypothetical protein